MNSTALELYFYMCSPEPIIEWLEEEKVKTYKEALIKLQPSAQSNLLSIASQIGRGARGVTAGGMVNCLKQIEQHYEKKKKK